MATGTVSSIGVGSGLDLQGILDQLREVDENLINIKKTKISDLEAQLEEFTVVNNKLLTMKSAALGLSLDSTYLGRTVTSSNEEVLTASVVDGATVQSFSFNVSRLATRSSWQTDTGYSSQDHIVYVPTLQQSTTGVTNPGGDVVATNGETLTITYGGTETISLNIAADRTMNDLVDDINNHVDNQDPGGPGDNDRFVTAETYTVGTETFLRIKSDISGGTGETNRVAISETLANLSFSTPDDVFEYTFGSGADQTTVTLNVAADTKLSELVTLINNDTNNPGITASVINDGSTDPYRFILRADSTGEDYRINVTDQVPDIILEEKQGAAAASLNALVTVDGIDYERQTNSFSDIMTGVTLTLNQAGTSSVSVAGNTENIKTLIMDLVTAFNDVVQEINSNVDYDEDEEEFGVLADSTLRNLPYELQNLMTSTIKADSDKSITTMFDLGMEFERDGTISLDESVLNEAIANNAADIQEFFLGDDDNDITGMADLVNERLRTITTLAGQVQGEKEAAQEKIDALELQIESEVERLDKKYELMAKQFIELDRYMNQMTSISSFLSSQFESLNQLWGSSNNKN